MTPLQSYSADHRALLAAATQATGLRDLVSFDPGDFRYAMLNRSVRGPVQPLQGVLIRDWDRSMRSIFPGFYFGVRTYSIQGIRYLRVCASSSDSVPSSGYDFFAVSRSDYRALFRIAKWCSAQANPPGLPPVLDPETVASLLRNTVEYLDADNLKEIMSFGGRPKRGLLLTGPPGNGKTSACRWVWHQCQSRGLEYKIVSPDDYRAARQACNPAAAIRELFRVSKAGVIFFDDLDMALRNRAHVENPEDQAVFLSALDGIEVNSGAVYVFTTNLSPERIDPAFLRPGRIDALLHFPKPNTALRRQLIDRWHEAIRAALDWDRAIRETDGFSFAEIEEVKNLLVLRYTETRNWSWEWAIRQFHRNRSEVESMTANRIVGFAPKGAEKDEESVPSVAGRGSNG